jgi:hypothetical protein
MNLDAHDLDESASGSSFESNIRFRRPCQTASPPDSYSTRTSGGGHLLTRQHEGVEPVPHLARGAEAESPQPGNAWPQARIVIRRRSSKGPDGAAVSAGGRIRPAFR